MTNQSRGAELAIFPMTETPLLLRGLGRDTSPALVLRDDHGRGLDRGTAEHVSLTRSARGLVRVALAFRVVVLHAGEVVHPEPRVRAFHTHLGDAVLLPAVGLASARDAPPFTFQPVSVCAACGGGQEQSDGESEARDEC